MLPKITFSLNNPLKILKPFKILGVVLLSTFSLTNHAGLNDFFCSVYCSIPDNSTNSYDAPNGHLCIYGSHLYELAPPKNSKENDIRYFGQDPENLEKWKKLIQIPISNNQPGRKNQLLILDDGAIVCSEGKSAIHLRYTNTNDTTDHKYKAFSLQFEGDDAPNTADHVGGLGMCLTYDSAAGILYFSRGTEFHYIQLAHLHNVFNQALKNLSNPHTETPIIKISVDLSYNQTESHSYKLQWTQANNTENRSCEYKNLFVQSFPKTYTPVLNQNIESIAVIDRAELCSSYTDLFDEHNTSQMQGDTPPVLCLLFAPDNSKGRTPLFSTNLHYRSEFQVDKHELEDTMEYKKPLVSWEEPRASFALPNTHARYQQVTNLTSDTSDKQKQTLTALVQLRHKNLMLVTYLNSNIGSLKNRNLEPNPTMTVAEYNREKFDSSEIIQIPTLTQTLKNLALFDRVCFCVPGIEKSQADSKLSGGYIAWTRDTVNLNSTYLHANTDVSPNQRGWSGFKLPDALHSIDHLRGLGFNVSHRPLPGHDTNPININSRNVPNAKGEYDFGVPDTCDAETIVSSQGVLESGFGDKSNIVGTLLSALLSGDNVKTGQSTRTDQTNPNPAKLLNTIAANTQINTDVQNLAGQIQSNLKGMLEGLTSPMRVNTSPNSTGLNSKSQLNISKSKDAEKPKADINGIVNTIYCANDQLDRNEYELYNTIKLTVYELDKVVLDLVKEHTEQCESFWVFYSCEYDNF